MDKFTFRKHLSDASNLLVEFTCQYCYNDISKNFKYRIIPNSRTVEKNDNQLTQNEISILKTWNKYADKLLNTDEITDLLHRENKVPVWINITIYEASADFTIIDLLCSRRIRDDNELYHKGPVMPFHVQVAMPPEHLKIEREGKFDVNWKKHQDGKRKSNALFSKFKNFLKRV